MMLLRAVIRGVGRRDFRRRGGGIRLRVRDTMQMAGFLVLLTRGFRYGNAELHEDEGSLPKSSIALEQHT